MVFVSIFRNNEMVLHTHGGVDFQPYNSYGMFTHQFLLLGYLAPNQFILVVRMDIGYKKNKTWDGMQHKILFVIGDRWFRTTLNVLYLK